MGPEGLCCVIQTLGWHARGRERQLGYMEQFRWRPVGALHADRDCGAPPSLKRAVLVQLFSLQHHSSPERQAAQEQEAATVPSPIQVSVCTRLLEAPPTLPSTPSSRWLLPSFTPPLTKKIHKFKQGKERKKEERKKKNQDHCRAVQIGGSAGCRSNQLMQLSWRPPVDHLPSSRVAVVAVSAGLAPRRARPPRPGGSHLPSPGLFVPHAAGAGRGASPLPGSPWGTATCGRSRPGLSGQNGQLCFLFCRVFARSPSPPHKLVVVSEHLCACTCLGFTWCACRETGTSPVLQGGAGTPRNWWHLPHPTGLPQG